jgi:hypothetical protein
MKRAEFTKITLRIMLFTALAAIAAILGKRTETGSTCSSCSGRGVCNGKTDCGKYLSVVK